MLTWLAAWASALAHVATAASSPATWNCGEAQWLGQPGMSEGRFEGRLGFDCAITRATARDLRPLLEAIAPEAARTQTHFAGRSLFALDSRAARLIEDEGDTIRLVERVRVETDLRYLLHAEINSENIEGEGMASYLRELDFQASFARDPGDTSRLVARLETSVSIERPWYAPSVFFSPIAKSKTRSKNERKVQELMALYARKLGGSE